MRPHDGSFAKYTLAMLIVGVVLGCGPSPSTPQTGSQTNWLQACRSDDQCGGDFECVCGVCTRLCEGEGSCIGLPGGTCVAAEDVSAIALCGAETPPSPGMCLARCEPEGCPMGSSCIDGMCAVAAAPPSIVSTPEPTPPAEPTVPLEPSAVVTIDTALSFQTLVGFGGAVAYVEGAIANSAQREAVYDAMFGDSGFDMVRFRNRFANPGDDDLTFTGEIVSAATARLGHAPLVLLTSWSPPAALKANASSNCGGNLDTCTLSRLADGSFDYAGFAGYWRSSLDAYAAVGVQPQYIGIQNNPNWVPPATGPLQACHFLPTEGSSTVTMNGVDVEIPYPGFDEAVTAVAGALQGLASVPKIVGPETTGVEGVADYASVLDLSAVGALGHHLYGTDPGAIDPQVLSSLSELGRQYQLPIFQTEMQAGGLETAVLVHHALVTGGASVYLQNDLVGVPLTIADPGDLIILSDAGVTLQLPYYALRHFAHDTDPGWVRVSATTTVEPLLTSAWLSPTGDALTVVIVNPGLEEREVGLEFPVELGTTSNVTRTIFGGSERAADLGQLPADSTLLVPAEAIVTIALHR